MHRDQIDNFVQALIKVRVKVYRTHFRAMLSGNQYGTENQENLLFLHGNSRIVGLSVRVHACTVLSMH